MTLRATPLDQTSIQTGGRRRELAKSRLARRGFHTHRTTHGSGHSRRLPAGAKSKTPGTSADQAERRRKSSLFRRLSNKRASAEIQQVTSSSLTEAKSEDKSMLSRGNTISRGFRSAGEHWGFFTFTVVPVAVSVLGLGTATRSLISPLGNFERLHRVAGF